jgi:phosphoserine/homoserine phosphotransferase
MRQRLRILQENNLGLIDIQNVIATLKPLPGANEFIEWLRQRYQVVILSDTFYEFAAPFMKQLDWPLLLCHKLAVDGNGMVTDYILRQSDAKRQSVKAFHTLGFKVIASGDSYNDTSMLSEANAGILFRPPQNVMDEFPQFPVAREFDELKTAFVNIRISNIRSRRGDINDFTISLAESLESRVITLSFTSAEGAWSLIPMHGVHSRENLPSGVDSPKSIPSSWRNA